MNTTLTSVADAADVFTKAQDFVAALDAMVSKAWADRQYSFSLPPKHSATVGGKWIKVVRHDVNSDGSLSGGSVYAFIAVADFANKALGQVRKGDIHKPASWAQPAKHARGNVFADNFGGGHGTFGMAYLRG